MTEEEIVKAAIEQWGHYSRRQSVECHRAVDFALEMVRRHNEAEIERLRAELAERTLERNLFRDENGQFKARIAELERRNKD